MVSRLTCNNKGCLLTECQRLKAQVVQQIRSNQQLEQDLYTMDIKIGLLVKNTISLEDVVSHSRQVSRNRTRGAADGQDLVASPGTFSKQTQAKIEVSYGNMCVGYGVVVCVVVWVWCVWWYGCGVVVLWGGVWGWGGMGWYGVWWGV